MELNTAQLDIFLPVIDDRSEEELVQQAQDLVSFLSNGQLNDFSEGNPLAVLLRAQAFAQAEFLWRINKFPLRLIVEFMRLAGVERKLETKAVVALTFTLSSPRPQAFQIPAGFEVVASSGNISFFTDSILTIPAGTLSGMVTATAKNPGTASNVPAYSLNRITQPLAFLSAVTNTTAASGGSNGETAEQAINRGFQQIRRRNLVSALDFEEAAVEILGVGAGAKCIGLLGPDQITITPGAIHLFCLDVDGFPAGLGATSNVLNQLRPNILLGTTLTVSPMPISPVHIEVVARVTSDLLFETIADNIEQQVIQFFSPQQLGAGQTCFIEELRHRIRFADGVSLVDYILLNELPNNVEPDTDYTKLQYASLTLRLTDGQGNLYEAGRGPLLDDL